MTQTQQLPPPIASEWLNEYRRVVLARLPHRECKGCRWQKGQKGTPYVSGSWDCSHRTAAIGDPASDGYQTFHYAVSMRHSTTDAVGRVICGPEARFWEPRES